MNTTEYFCRHCGRETNHKVVKNNYDKPVVNTALLHCMMCPQSAFTVEFSKNEQQPTRWAKRTDEVIGNDEQKVYQEEHPSDIPFSC